MDDFVPHMTLAKTNYGLTAQELKEVAKEAETELKPFPVFHVDSIRVYQEAEPNTYTPWKDIPLNG